MADARSARNSANHFGEVDSLAAMACRRIKRGGLLECGAANKHILRAGNDLIVAIATDYSDGEFVGARKMRGTRPQARESRGHDIGLLK